MAEAANEFLRLEQCPRLERATLVLALTGWMDGGDVSTGTVQRLVDLLEAPRIAEIEAEPFYLYNFPGSMEIAALFRPHIKIENGLVASLDMPKNTFYCHTPANLVLFVGKEPNLRWPTFGTAVVALAHQVGVRRILFVGSFGGAVPHTREPRLYVTCSDANLLPEMEQYGLRRTGYEGPGSFTSYLLTRAPAEGLEMTSLVAEIPGYLQGRNPMSIEAVTRRLAKILKLPLDLQTLREESTEWELQVSKIVARDKEMAKTVRQLEEAYDNELLEREAEEREEA
jgi:proteasome assembly chaperone (PAC2) family protein